MTERTSPLHACARGAKRHLRVALALGLLTLAGCQAELYSGQSDRSVNEMIVALAAAGIEASRVPGEDGKFGIAVSRRDFAQAITVLSDRGLPRRQYGSIGEAFSSETIVSTPFEERARFMFAVGQELSASLTKIAGVTDASVIVNVPEDQPLSDENVASSASVFIYKDPSVDLQGSVATIKKLVANSVDGLDYEDVEVGIYDAGSASVVPVRRTTQVLSIPALVGYGVLALVGLFLWRKLTSRKPTRRLTGNAESRSRRIAGPAA